MVEICLYFHIPFCARKCPYCHFYVLASKEHEPYMEGLLLEWESKKALLADKTVVSVYFGGGTPTQLPPEEIERILSWIRADCTIAPDVEITLEANPEDVDEKITAYKDINRISMGVQSFDNKLLKTLGRSHTAEEAINAVHLCAPFGNTTIDLMYEVPGQSIASWEKSLVQTEALPLHHLSLYNLTFEPKTPFYRKRKTLQPLIMPEEERTKCFSMPDQILSKLLRYEISAFAIPGFESRHNTGYWKGRPFLGFGPSAFSYWDKSRFCNHANLRKWIAMLKEGKSPVGFSEKLDEKASQNELLIIGLRMLKGVSKKEIGPLDTKTLESLKELEHKGFIKSLSDRWQLAEKGLLFHDTVAEALI